MSSMAQLRLYQGSHTHLYLHSGSLDPAIYSGIARLSLWAAPSFQRTSTAGILGSRLRFR